jgi:dolichol-phosphate mannosyltransferase
MDGGKVVNWPLHRRVISRFGTWYAQTTLRLPYRDLTGGYRLISREAFSLVNLESIQSHGYGFQIEMAMRIHDAGGAIAQVPITFVEREHGESKMSRAIVLEAFMQTTKWALHRVVNAR